jgi:hypothetical protein
MMAPLQGTLPGMTCPFSVAVPKGTKAPVVALSSLSGVSGFGVVYVTPASLISLQGVS